MKSSSLTWIFVLISCLILTAFIVSLASAEDIGDVAYILKDKDNPDLNLVNSINELGYTVDYISYARISEDEDFSSYKMLLVGNEDFSDTSKIPVSKYKSLIINSYNYYRIGSFLSRDYQFGLSKSKGKSSSPAKIKNLDLESSIVSGFGEYFNAYVSKDPDVSVYYLKGEKARGIKIISYVSGATHTSGDAVVAVFFPGAEFLNGKTAEQRVLFLGLTETDSWTAESRQVFKNSVQWIILGEDRDGDGFYTDNDCDDSNKEINPDAEEIPYNGIDEDCSGSDLTDIDEDGFDAVEAGGADCDDTNSEINPGALDIIDHIDQNCINDAPVLIDNLMDYEWDEDVNKVNLFNLRDYFADKEGQELSFRAEGNEDIDIIIKDGNVSFFPHENWNGQEEIKFIASDSELEAKSDIIKIIINPISDEPFIKEIQDLVLVETELFELQFDAVDPDNENLISTFYEPLDVEGRWKPEIGDVGVYESRVRVEDTQGNFYIREFSITILPKIYINEIYAGEEPFIELYNPGQALDLSDFMILIDDTEVSLEDTIQEKGFFIIEPDFAIEKTGGVLLINKMTLTDSIIYLIEPDPLNSISRMPDGGEELQIQKPTKGFSNTADVIEPEIRLLEPEDNKLFDVREILFNFTVSDNSASSLTCSFYSDVNGSFEKLGADIVLENDSIGYALLKDIEDGNYIWSVECSDSRNSIFSENRTFSVNAPDAPVIKPIQDIEINEQEIARIVIEASDADDDKLDYYINDSRFVQTENNIFEWQTDYESSGEYEVEVRVDDRTLETSQIIKIKVLNVNREPVIVEISNIETQEDITKQIEISVPDPDLDTLSFTTNGDEKISCSVVKLEGEDNKFILEIMPAENKNGQAQCEITVQDGQGGSDSKIAVVNILPINDAPILTNEIPDQVWKQDNSHILNLEEYFYDVDLDDIEYLFKELGNLDIIIENNLMTFIPDKDWYGEKDMRIIASDGKNNTASNVFKLKIERVNKPPILDEIPEVNIEEDSGKQKVTFSAVDLDGYIDYYEVIYENTDEVDCIIQDNELYVLPSENWYGTTTCLIMVVDNDGAADSKIALINVLPINDAPIILAVPDFDNPILKVNKEYEFSILTDDIDNLPGELSVRWYVNGEERGQEDNFYYLAEELGSHEIKVVVNDLEGSSFYNWHVSVVDKPVASKYNSGTIDLIQEMSGVILILENEFGKIEFFEPADLSENVDFDHFSAIEYKKAGLDADYFSNLRDKRARYSFYNVYEAETVYYYPEFDMAAGDIGICPLNICENITFQNNTLSFETKNFGSFFVGSLQTCSALGGDICNEEQICKEESWIPALDTDRCCSYSCSKKPLEFKDLDTCDEISNAIEIQIKEPDENDEFSIGDMISGTLKIRNMADEDLEFDIEIYLYDIENDDEVESVEQNIDIDEGDKETLDFEITIPEDIEDADHVIFVKVVGENDEEYCNQAYQKIDIEREKHNVIIQNIGIEEPTVKPGEYVGISVEALNIGQNEEEAYIEIENSELGIQGRSDKFNIDDYFGDDNSLIKRFNVKIPEDAEQKEYDIKAIVVFDSEENSATKKIAVSESVELTSEVSKVSSVLSQDAAPIIRKARTKPISSSFWIVVELLFGIAVLTILIVVISRSR